jgi:ankyrin repeat protein
VNSFCVITREQKKRHTMGCLHSTQIEFSNETEGLSFHQACAEGNLKVVKIYLARLRFDINVRVHHGHTGFHYACINGNLNVVQFLVQKGFDINVRDNYGKPGFHYACLHGGFNVVQFLVQKGFDMNVCDNHGYTGFHLACSHGRLHVLELLVQQGFEGINDHYGDGMTVLECLIKQKRILSGNELFIPCILLLIESGAQMNKNDVFQDLIPAIQNRIIEITFMKEKMFEKWTGRIAQAITDYAINPSLRNLSQILD